MLNEKLVEWCVEMREKLLSFIISERRNSLNIVVWLENWMKTVEASIAVHPERYDKKESGDICVQIGDSETSAKHSVTFPKKLASFESKSKALMDQGETNFANKWYQTSKELKSRTVQTEVEKILVDISCQVEDFNNGTSASENSATFSSTNAQNEVVIVQENAGTRYMGFSCQALDQEGRRKMKDIFTGNGSFTLYTFCQTEGIPGSTDVRSKYPTFFSASMQTKYSNEYTEVVSQIGGIQCADHLNEIDVRTDGRSHARTASTSIEFGNEIVLCAKPALVIQNRNSISERLKNAFRTLRLVSWWDFSFYFFNKVFVNPR